MTWGKGEKSMNTRMKIAVIVAAIALPAMILQAQSELPLHQKRLSERALVVWTGDYMQTIATVALATAKGIVVIDTSLIRSDDARVRRFIEMEFGRSDFKYLINTHYHHDHTAGNQIYSDATIIGHKNALAGMKAELTGEGLAKLIESLKTMFKSWQEGFQHVAPGSRDYHRGREGLILLPIAIAELQEGLTPTYPSIRFEKSLVLDMGDMTLELYSFAGIHTDSDIVIFVPEEGLLAVGDMPPDTWLPYLRKEMDWDLGEILENWGRIVDSGREIRHCNMAHSDMFLSVETFKEQYRYFKTLWDGLREIHRRGLTIEDAKKAYSIEKDFPYFKDRRLEVQGTNIHAYNIEAIWERMVK
jgi:glyoxylase-like metal-dependent hydrolase (beta-lactamase superfamily II)